MARIINDEGDNIVACRAAYLESAINDMDSLVYTATKRLMDRDMLDKFDTLVGRGLSGALVVPYVARALDKHWLIVRKTGDGSHSHELAEGNLGHAWLFFDDLICSGKTLAATVSAVKEICASLGYETTFVGAYTYAPPQLWEVDALPLPEALKPDWRAELTEQAVTESNALPYDTQDENGNPVYATPTWAAIAQDYLDNPDLRGFMAMAKSMPSMDEAYAELKGKYYTPRPNKPKPPGRGGKARRQLDQLKEMRAAQQAALNARLDIICQQMINARITFEQGNS